VSVSPLLANVALQELVTVAWFKLITTVHELAGALVEFVTVTLAQ
jgi:hypothetical protein